MKSLSSFHLLAKMKDVQVLSHAKCIFGPVNAFRDVREVSMILDYCSFLQLTAGSQIYD